MPRSIIVHSIERHTQGKELAVTAAIERISGPNDGVRPLWFWFPAGEAHLVSTRADAVVVSLLMAAMWEGRDVRVRGSISRRLAYGIQEFQHAIHAMFPRQAEIVDVQCDEYVDATEDYTNGGEPGLPRGIGTAFSAGVDSFYSLWRHTPPRERVPGDALTHGLFVQGFDISLADPQSFNQCRAAYTKLFDGIGLKLLSARTNIREWYIDKPWGTTHIGPLLGVGLMYERALRRFYIPAGATYDYPAPWGMWTLATLLLATETFQSIQDGADVGRSAKTGALADWEATYPYLRVCPLDAKGLVNCSRCGKCIETMALLDAAGRLDRYTTFPLPLSRSALRGMQISYLVLPVALTMMRESWKAGRRGTAVDLGVAIARNHVRWASGVTRKRLQFFTTRV